MTPYHTLELLETDEGYKVRFGNFTGSVSEEKLDATNFDEAVKEVCDKLDVQPTDIRSFN